ncbi:hypothetical protein ISF_07717 [Cordyceps fumosorosea ARSEF 2679]|uniref:Uncharacterized protein n=1 Tax=Cordyceps fumosorosea (strain ARSEF 2679) TaxID=1081104 RepID=A0A167NZK3_CORFA|nr:hypothetical protein ISF_07717 [Cordyceps fumosorosea ARSEF 2679]OAA56119.1 hypothetical protein ISF_07717 [Cordyceps fumosorosea ARSEF 2679]
MSRLPPVDKLPLAIRKDVRDNWESKKEDSEKQLGEILGEKWTIDIDAKAIYPYGEDRSYAKESTGAMIAEYVDCAIRGLRRYVEQYGDDAKNEINKVASAHSIIMDLDVDKKVSYCGAGITADGQLAMLWQDGNLASNIDHVFSERSLTAALNAVPSEGISFETRLDIKQSYDDKIADVRTRINTALKREYTLEPGFEAAYAKLSGTQAEFKENLGQFVFLYFEALAGGLVSQKFDSDDMMQEALNEAVESGKIAFRVVDKAQMKETYSEAVIEDGVLYLQTSPDYYGSNIDHVWHKLVDQL